MSTNFTGTLNNYEGTIETDEEVSLESDGRGGFKLTANGHNLSLAGVTKLILRRNGVSEGSAKVDLPSGASAFISSDRSPLANEVAEVGTVLTPVYQGKAAGDSEEEFPQSEPLTDAERILVTELTALYTETPSTDAPTDEIENPHPEAV